MLVKLDYKYNDEISIVHRINPVIKILCFFIYLLIVLLKFNSYLFILNIFIVFLLMLLSNVNILRYFKVIWKLKYIVIIMYAFMLHKQMKLISINVIVFEFLFTFLYMALIVYTTTKEDLGKGSARIISIFDFLNIGVKRISYFITNIFTLIIYLIEDFNSTIEMLEIKGIIYTHGTIIDKVKLVFKNIKKIYSYSKTKMNNRKFDMKYRLYNSKVKSKYKYRTRLNIFDIILLIINIGMIVFYILKVR